MDSNSIANFLGRHLRIVLILTIVIFLTIPISFLMVVRGRVRNEEKQVREFVVQIIDSINDKSDFHVRHVRTRAIQNIEKNIGKISKNYKIHLIDISGGLFEYNVIFDSLYSFKISARKSNSGFIIRSFKFFSNSKVMPDE